MPSCHRTDTLEAALHVRFLFFHFLFWPLGPRSFLRYFSLAAALILGARGFLWHDFRTYLQTDVGLKYFSWQIRETLFFAVQMAYPLV